MLKHGDCLIEMMRMEPNSIDFIITDPPYGLHFMGKDWDGKVPSVDIWQEALRVAKPGAMLAAFGGSRTHHHLMIALEKAGWEIRDVVMFLYGSGFPKSLNIGKAIDKAKGEIREVIGRKEGERYKYEFKSDFNEENKTSRLGRGDAGILTAPSSDLAKTFDGFGTALKPAYEPIIIAMKPLDGTFAQNAEKWGVAGINVDESRIPSELPEGRLRHGGGKHSEHIKQLNPDARNEIPSGRWPANVILDEEAGAMLDEQSGISKSSNAIRKNNRPLANCLGKYNPDETHGFNDSGGASRFFYCAKASSRERGEGNSHPTVKPIALMKYIIKLLAPPGDPILLDPFAGSGSTLIAAKELGVRFIGIEKEKEYCEIAERRLDAA